jgi:hypothetical protein
MQQSLPVRSRDMLRLDKCFWSHVVSGEYDGALALIRQVESGRRYPHQSHPTTYLVPRNQSPLRSLAQNHGDGFDGGEIRGRVPADLEQTVLLNGRADCLRPAHSCDKTSLAECLRGLTSYRIICPAFTLPMRLKAI